MTWEGRTSRDSWVCNGSSASLATLCYGIRCQQNHGYGHGNTPATIFAIIALLLPFFGSRSPPKKATSKLKEIQHLASITNQKTRPSGRLRSPAAQPPGTASQLSLPAQLLTPPPPSRPSTALAPLRRQRSRTLLSSLRRNRRNDRCRSTRSACFNCARLVIVDIAVEL